MILRTAVFLGIAVALVLAACSDAADEPTLAELQTRTAPDELPECKICPPDLEMRVGDAVLRGAVGSFQYNNGNIGVFSDAFAIITPEQSVEAPLGVDGVIVLPPEFSGTRTRLVVYEVVPEAERNSTANCLTLERSGDEVTRWSLCAREIEAVVTEEFAETHMSNEFSIPLSEFVTEPGLFVISLFAEISTGPETWDGEFGFFVETVRCAREGAASVAPTAHLR